MFLTVLFLTTVLTSQVMAYPWNGQSSWQSSDLNGYSSASLSSNPGGFSSTSIQSGVGPLKARIVIRNRQVINLSTGLGSVSISVNQNGVHIIVNGMHFDSPDVIGPYVVTNEQSDGALVRREMTPEDEALITQHEQAVQQSINNMNQMFANIFGSGFGMQPMQFMQPMTPMQSMWG